MNVIEKYCFIKTQYLIDDMMYEKTLNYIREKVFYYYDLYDVNKR
jgi:hypothetical protein